MSVYSLVVGISPSTLNVWKEESVRFSFFSLGSRGQQSAGHPEVMGPVTAEAPVTMIVTPLTAYNSTV